MRRNLVTAAITLALCAATSVASAQAPAATPNKAAAQVTTQLPRNVRPTNYDIEIVLVPKIPSRRAARIAVRQQEGVSANRE